MSASDPDQRRRIASRAAHIKWANTRDRSAATAKARRAFFDKLERQADPDGRLTPTERARRAEHLHRAHIMLMTERAVAARKAKRATQAPRADLGGDAA